MITAVTPVWGFEVDPAFVQTLHSNDGGSMKDIHEVLRRKQAQHALLGKQIEMLQQAAEKLREVAPLLAENDEEETAVLAEVSDENGKTMAAAAGAHSSATASKSGRNVTPRWP
jgi:hypothetical protein